MAVKCRSSRWIVTPKRSSAPSDRDLPGLCVASWLSLRLRLSNIALILSGCLTLLAATPMEAARLVPSSSVTVSAPTGLVIAPAAAAFGDTKLGTTTKPLSFTATNYTTSAIGYVSLTGSPEFSLQPGTCHLVGGEVMLAVGASCTFTATFAPTVLGSANATMNISTSSGPYTFQLTGTAVPAITVVFTPGTAAFGSVNVGSSSPTLAITAVNDTDSTVGYVNVAGSSEFHLSPGTCSLANNAVMLAEVSSCTFYASFAPTAPGAVTAALNISTSSGPYTFQLTGTGVAVSPISKPGGPYTGVTGIPVAFTGSGSNAPSGQTITGYVWNFGDGMSGAGATPTHTYTAPGTYNVTLTVTDTKGQTGAATTTTKVAAAPNPLSITAKLSPAPNAAGWNNSPVTVSYTCSSTGSPVTFCPSPETISADTAAQLVTGTAADANGDTKTATVTVNVELSPPVLSITSPAVNSTITLSNTSIGINGSVSSDVASITSVTCNSAPATLSGSAFNCSGTLKAGANPLPIVATDIAGNKTTVPLNLTYVVAPSLQILAPTNLGITNLTPVTVNGTVSDPNATIKIDGVAVPQSGGGFSTPVPLVEGLNIITAVATNAGGVSTTATIEITLDTTPPHVQINSPANGSVVTTSSVGVTGLANDVVVGTVNLQDLSISVNGVAAQVANRSFSAMNVPLTLGANTIKATGTDRAGNTASTSITVMRVLPSQPPAPPIGAAVLTQWVNVLSGNNQTGVVGTALASPVVVSLTDSASHPIANKTVVFQVTANNGLVAAAGQAPSSAAAVTTDSNGNAQVTWTLGQRAGAGNNMLQVSSALAVSPVTVTATGTTGKPAMVVVDSGNNQTGVLGQPLAFPFVVDVVDAGHNRVPGIPIIFTVKKGGGSFAGAPRLSVTSDSNGRAIAVLTTGLTEGINNNLVEANFTGNTFMPAAFIATAESPGSVSATTISGIVLDNSNQPIPGVTIRLYQTNQGSGNNLPVQVGNSVITDKTGSFVIASAPVGAFKLMADGSTATTPLTYPTLEYDIVTVAGNDNTVGMPIYLPALDTVNKVCVDETHGGTLTLPQYPGFALAVAPGSATFPGGSRTGCVSVTPVNGDKVPMSPGFGQQPRFIVTIQPVGTVFNPPAAMTLPNVDGLKPKQVTEMYSYDHDLAMFVAIGTGTVSSDGSVITSDPGVGVVKAGWHCGGDPNTIGSAGTCPLCQACQGDGCAADPSQDGTPAPEDKCMACMNGALAPIPLDPTEKMLSYTFVAPSETIMKINEDLKELTEIGVLASITPASIGGSITTKECCSKETGKDTSTKGMVTGTAGAFSFKGKIWPPGPIPSISIEVDAFGLASLDASVTLVAGIFAGLDGTIQGELGYSRDGCSEKAEDRAGCVFADVTAPLTFSLSATIGGKGEATYSCFVCDTTSIAIDASFNFGNLQFPLNVVEATYNLNNGEVDCSVGFKGGTLDWQPAKFKIGGEFVGSWSTNNGVVRQVKFSDDLLSCTIDLTNGIKCPPYF